jgi:FtsZ-binding cell division protein ZapB
MSEENKKHESELRTNKIEVIKLLAEQLVSYKLNEFKDFKIEDDKPIAYYDATIDLLKKQVENAKISQAKLLKFDKTEQERENLSEDELKELKRQQEQINKRVDSYLATMEPRASLRGNIHMPGNIIIRYRGKGINDEFLKKYPFGVLL